MQLTSQPMEVEPGPLMEDLLGLAKDIEAKVTPELFVEFLRVGKGFAAGDSCGRWNLMQWQADAALDLDLDLRVCRWADAMEARMTRGSTGAGLGGTPYFPEVVQR